MGMAMAMEKKKVAMATEKKKMAEDPSSLSSSLKSDPNVASSSAADDLVSSLPDCVLTSIISLLSINDCVRTSILSSRWRASGFSPPSKSTIVPSTAANSNILLSSTEEQIIDTIIARHCRPIRIFRLSNRLFIGDGTLDRWIETLAQRGIQSLSTHANLSTHLNWSAAT